MCKYSLEGYNTRNAVRGETLIANTHTVRGHGCFTQPGEAPDGTLTCVRGGTVLTIEKLALRPQAEDFMRGYGFSERPLGFIGKRIIVKLMDGRGHPSGLDCLHICNISTRVLIPILLLQPGLEVFVGVKEVPKTLDDVLHLDEKSLRAIAADDPKDKEDEEKKEKEREPEPEKALAYTFEPVNPMVIEPPSTFRRAMSNIMQRRRRTSVWSD